MWSSDGRELFYLSPDEAQLMVADVSGSGADLVVRSSRVLVDNWSGQPGAFGSGYGVSADGRFLTVVRVQPTPLPNEINVVLNWFEELKRLVPTP